MKLSSVIDRIEGDKAVLLLDDETKRAVFPCACLPCGVKEGDHLTITITVDEQRTQEAKAEADDLLAQLLKNDTK